MKPLRVLIVSENISMKMGGEASLPYYYAKLFHREGAIVWLACHERVEHEVREGFAALGDRTQIVRDTRMQKAVYHLGLLFPSRIRELLFDQVIHWLSQVQLRTTAKVLAKSGQIDVVFEPSPISPKGVSMMYDIGVPVVIGPMCGGIDFPPAFRHLDGLFTRVAVSSGRALSRLVNSVWPGKLRANLLIAANASTVNALPFGHNGNVERLFESGVDLDLWKGQSDAAALPSDGTITFAFSGRFVDWKGTQYLIPAFAKAHRLEPRCRLSLVGDGELMERIRADIVNHNVSDAVVMHGWLARPEAAKILRDCDVFVMPSLRECGGTAILEAMAMGKPIIATNWGGPADYVNANCGILVDPTSEEAFVNGLAAAMVELAKNSAKRKLLGEGGSRRVLEDGLDWSSKAKIVLRLLHDTSIARLRAKGSAVN